MARLDNKYLASYPANSMLFYLYGGKQLHIDHVLLVSPNIQLNTDCITIKRLTRMDGSPLSELRCDATVEATEAKLGRSTGIGSPYVMHFVHVPERAMQPFPKNGDIAEDENFFFQSEREYEIVISKDVSMREVFAKGIVWLSDYLFIDTDMLNSSRA